MISIRLLKSLVPFLVHYKIMKEMERLHIFSLPSNTKQESNLERFLLAFKKGIK